MANEKESGAEALAHFAPLTARLKPCPCYKTQFQQSFVIACKAVPFYKASCD